MPHYLIAPHYAVVIRLQPNPINGDGRAVMESVVPRPVLVDEFVAESAANRNSTIGKPRNVHFAQVRP